MADEDRTESRTPPPQPISSSSSIMSNGMPRRRTASRVRISQPPRKSQPNPSGPTPPPSFITVIYTFIISFAPHRPQPLTRQVPSVMPSCHVESTGMGQQQPRSRATTPARNPGPNICGPMQQCNGSFTMRTADVYEHVFRGSRQFVTGATAAQPSRL